MFKRYVVAFILIVSAGTILANFYQGFSQNPWTRDGRVNAHVITITPRVTGQVNAVYVQDNSVVKKAIYCLRSIRVYIKPLIKKHKLLSTKLKQLWIKA